MIKLLSKMFLPRVSPFLASLLGKLAEKKGKRFTVTIIMVQLLLLSRCSVLASLHDQNRSSFLEDRLLSIQSEQSEIFKKL